MNPTLCLIIPCYNEEEVLPQIYATLSTKLATMIHDGLISPQSSLVFVDDGSKDNTWNVLDSLIKCPPPPKLKNSPFDTKATDISPAQDTKTSLKPNIDSIPRIIAIKLSTNKGHQNALLAGLEYAKERCDCAISIDCDLQDDIDVLEIFVQKFRDGAQIVYGARKRRQNDSVFKKYSALGFYKLMHLMGVKIIYNHADYRLLSRRAIESLMEFKEVNLFLRGIAPLLGYKSDVVYYDRLSREFGESKYPLRKMLSFAWNRITSFSIMPLRLVSVLGFVFFMLSLGIGGYALYIKFFTDNALWGWASTLIPLSFFSGIQLLSLGVIGEYIGKIYIESKHRPRYFIEEIRESKL